VVIFLPTSIKGLIGVAAGALIAGRGIDLLTFHFIRILANQELSSHFPDERASVPGPQAVTLSGSGWGFSFGSSQKQGDSPQKQSGASRRRRLDSCWPKVQAAWAIYTGQP
jgi:hypothetical protein